jgi:hypothetical protein
VGALTATLLLEFISILSGTDVWILALLVFLPSTASALCTVRQAGFMAAWTAVTVTAVLRAPGGHWLDRMMLVLFTSPWV